RARIVAVADCYDALTHDRPYRKSLGHESAVAWIWQMAGKNFDPKVVDAFLLVVEQKEKSKAATASVEDEPRNASKPFADENPKPSPMSV
ncbi:MAG: hypothetical protein JSW50_01230, partial [Candidatus Latescibacterota bacterium]